MKQALIGLLFFAFVGSALFAADKLKDFRGTSQSVALIGISSEFVEPTTEGKLLSELRKRFNKYSKSYGDSSIAGFKMDSNPGKQFFRPVLGDISEPQKKFLVATAKNNSIDILVLGSFRQSGDETEVELQLFDSRIEALSKVEKARIAQTGNAGALDDLVYRVMNYLDREGYVYNTPQDFLEPPMLLQQSRSSAMNSGPDDFSLNPSDLAGAGLAGELSVGGDKTPFWEKWWFWTLLGGGALTAGVLSYYFLVVDQPPSTANINVVMP